MPGFLVPLRTAAATNQWEAETMPTSPVAWFTYHSSFKRSLVTYDFPFDVGRSQVIAQNLPGCFVRLASEIFAPGEDVEFEDDGGAQTRTDPESTRTSSRPPSRRLRDAQENGHRAF